jgi:hypothetical protein
MIELERRVLDALTPTRQKRFRWLVASREQLAHVIAEMTCWGVVEIPSLDRQLQLTEEAIAGLSKDSSVTASLLAEYVVADAALIHRRGLAPDGFACQVCLTGGAYGLGDVLARFPDLID